jgi:hypothetical protein
MGMLDIIRDKDLGAMLKGALDLRKRIFADRA